MKNSERLTNIIESILFVSGAKVAVSDISEKLGVTDKDVLNCAKKLQSKYSDGSGIKLLIYNNKLQFCSNSDYADEVSSVLNPIKEKELSRSMLEVAAIIAYKQPVTRIDLEEIRGNSEYAVQKLLELGVIEPVGRKDAVGKPVLFGTTDEFLRRFQISSLDELPDYDELINKISLLNSDKDDDDYLYKKDVYVEETAVTTDNANETSDGEMPVETPAIENGAEINSVNKDEAGGDDADFVLPDVADEEIPDFLKGEEVEKV